jgi:hypothetical protein
MTTLVLRHAWLQKHPSPTAASGEFHWHPASDHGGRRDDLRLALVDRLRGVVPPAALWQVAPGRVVWAQVFAATAPGDGRRYCGLAVTVAEAPGVPAAELLASLVVPPAAPWDGEPTERTVARVACPAAALTSTQRAHQPSIVPAPAAVVRALIAGGTAAVADPARPDLPAWIASLEAWLPPAIVARPRQGEWHGGPGGAALRGPAGHSSGGSGFAVAGTGGVAGDPVAALVVTAWCPPDPAAAARHHRAWAIVTELAASQARTADAVVADLQQGADLERALTRDERAVLALAAPDGSVEPWLHAVHHWGRGHLDGSATAGSLASRLADLVAMRALADHVAGRDERGALDRARWHALLPVARRLALLAAIAERVPSLGALLARRAPSRSAVEVAHA